MVMNLLIVPETQVWSLPQEYPLKKGVAIHSSILAWKIPWTKESGGLQSMGSQRGRHDWTSDTFTLTCFLKANACCLVTKLCLTLLWHGGLEWVAISFSHRCIPDPGIKFVSLVLSGKFFTTDPSGKPKGIYSLWYMIYIIFEHSKKALNIHICVCINTCV